MLKIRLQRIGKTKQAHYRLIVAEHTTRPQGKFLELLGSYNPHTKEISVKKERVEYWRSKGAQFSATANNLLINKKIIEGKKVQSWKPKKNKKEVAQSKSAPVPITANQ